MNTDTKTERGGWVANEAQLKAAVAADKVLKAGGNREAMLAAAKTERDVQAQKDEVELVTRRYLLAMTNRSNMAGRYSELSTGELLDIVACTALDGTPLPFEQFKAQLDEISRQSK